MNAEDDISKLIKIIGWEERVISRWKLFKDKNMSDIIEATLQNTGIDLFCLEHNFTCFSQNVYTKVKEKAMFCFKISSYYKLHYMIS